MKILITLDFPPSKGGIQHYLHSITLDHYSEDDIILAPGPDKREQSEAVQTKARIIYIGASSVAGKGRLLFSVALAMFRLRHRLKSVNHIECGNVYAAIPVWLSHTLHHIPYRVYTYGTELLALRTFGLKSLFLRTVLSNAQIVYALGTYTKSLLRAGGIRRPVRLRPPGIVVKSIPGDKLSRRNKYEILSVGRLVPHKRHRDLLAALSLIVHSNPWTVTIVGDGPERQFLTRTSEHLHIASKVALTGEVSEDEKKLIYCQAGVFVLTSMETQTGTEGFGIVLLEAMAHRIPVVAYATGEIPEILDNGSCGILVDPGNVCRLAQALESVWSNRRATRRRIANAYGRVCRLYSRYPG